MDIGPGDYVECIKVEFPEKSGFVEGGVYVVSEIHQTTGNLRFHGMENPNELGWPLEFGWWNRKAFRPIYRPKADAFTHLLTDIPSDLEVV